MNEFQSVDSHRSEAKETDQSHPSRGLKQTRSGREIENNSFAAVSKL